MESQLEQLMDQAGLIESLRRGQAFAPAAQPVTLGYSMGACRME